MENREPQGSAAIQRQETQGSLLLWEFRVTVPTYSPLDNLKTPYG